jgi:hypothetical protein
MGYTKQLTSGARESFAHLPADHSYLRNHAIEAHIASKAA